MKLKIFLTSLVLFTATTILLAPEASSKLDSHMSRPTCHRAFRQLRLRIVSSIVERTICTRISNVDHIAAGAMKCGIWTECSWVAVPI